MLLSRITLVELFLNKFKNFSNQLLKIYDIVHVHVYNYDFMIILLETYMRRVVKPLEALLTSHKRIVIKDSAVSNTVTINSL